MTYHCSKQTVKAGCVGFDGSPLRVAKSGAAAGARLTEGPGTPPLRPRRSSLRRASLPGAGGRRLPHPGLRSSAEETSRARECAMDHCAAAMGVKIMATVRVATRGRFAQANRQS